MITKAEENYLKAILKLSEQSEDSISTNAIADELSTKASSVTDMIKRLTDKQLVDYIPYHGVSLTKKGLKKAIEVIRKHRLWEVFLVNKLNFQWDEVHDVAEQLEHIRSAKLVNALDKFLGFPKHDPHGEPIPNKKGQFPKSFSQPLSILSVGAKGQVIGVAQDNPVFLKYLDSLNITLGTMVKVIKKIDFDLSMEIKINDRHIQISNDVAINLLIKEQ
ncbi:MAG: metal-dependent transcriptional regulator [Bacteroidota bacterium]|nr:metal-dependent transcriptional regulator [Bacteroidota bacterium]